MWGAIKILVCVTFVFTKTASSSGNLWRYQNNWQLPSNENGNIVPLYDILRVNYEQNLNEDATPSGQREAAQATNGKLNEISFIPQEVNPLAIEQYLSTRNVQNGVPFNGIYSDSVGYRTFNEPNQQSRPIINRGTYQNLESINIRPSGSVQDSAVSSQFYRTINQEPQIESVNSLGERLTNAAQETNVKSNEIPSIRQLVNPLSIEEYLSSRNVQTGLPFNGIYSESVGYRSVNEPNQQSTPITNRGSTIRPSTGSDSEDERLTNVAQGTNGKTNDDLSISQRLNPLSVREYLSTANGQNGQPIHSESTGYRSINEPTRQSGGIRSSDSYQNLGQASIRPSTRPVHDSAVSKPLYRIRSQGPQDVSESRNSLRASSGQSEGRINGEEISKNGARNGFLIRVPSNQVQNLVPQPDQPSRGYNSDLLNLYGQGQRGIKSNSIRAPSNDQSLNGNSLKSGLVSTQASNSGNRERSQQSQRVSQTTQQPEIDQYRGVRDELAGRTNGRQNQNVGSDQVRRPTGGQESAINRQQQQGAADLNQRQSNAYSYGELSGKILRVIKSNPAMVSNLENLKGQLMNDRDSGNPHVRQLKQLLQEFGKLRGTLGGNGQQSTPLDNLIEIMNRFGVTPTSSNLRAWVPNHGFSAWGF